MDIHIVKSILIAIAIGFMIGMQRAIYHLNTGETSFAGSRTFSIIALIGYLAGFINNYFQGFALVSAVMTGVVIAIAYYFKIYISQKGSSKIDYGSTTHFAAIATYLLGLMVSLNFEKYAIFAGVLVVVLLELKPRLQQFEAKITATDINAAVLLLAITFLVLPILPNKMIGPYHLFNPYKTWLMAVIISTLSFIGYAAIKIFGHKKGLFLTGALGGLVSSTAVTISMSKIAATRKDLAPHAAGAISLACTFMFLRIVVLAFVVNPSLALKLLWPFSITAAIGLMFTYYLFKHSRPVDIKLDDGFAQNPLQFSEAVKFGIIFGIVYGATHFVKAKYGDLGVYIVSFLSGITDVDAITLSLAQLASEGSLGLIAGVNGIVLASVVNSLVKFAISLWIGKRPLASHLIKYFLLTLGGLIISLWLLEVITFQ